MATRRNAARLTRSALSAASNAEKAPLRSASQSGYALSHSCPMSSAPASSALRSSISSLTLRPQAHDRDVVVSLAAAALQLRGYGSSSSRAYSTAASSTSQ
ncbi:hypothetical protein CRG98_026373, partial [Punica granatum]